MSNTIGAIPSVKEMVAGGKTAVFVQYRANALWYRPDCAFPFPGPIADAAGAAFKAEERAIQMMRWIRPQIALIEGARAQSAAGITAAAG